MIVLNFYVLDPDIFILHQLKLVNKTKKKTQLHEKQFEEELFTAKWLLFCTL